MRIVIILVLATIVIVQYRTLKSRDEELLNHMPKSRDEELLKVSDKRQLAIQVCSEISRVDDARFSNMMRGDNETAFELREHKEKLMEELQELKGEKK